MSYKIHFNVGVMQLKCDTHLVQLGVEKYISKTEDPLLKEVVDLKEIVLK